MLEFLQKRVGLSQRMSQAALDRHQEEEDAPVRTTWDTVQAITAIARDIPPPGQSFRDRTKSRPVIRQSNCLSLVTYANERPRFFGAFFYGCNSPINYYTKNWQ